MSRAEAARVVREELSRGMAAPGTLAYAATAILLAVVDDATLLILADSHGDWLPVDECEDDPDQRARGVCWAGIMQARLGLPLSVSQRSALMIAESLTKTVVITLGARWREMSPAHRRVVAAELAGVTQ